MRKKKYIEQLRTCVTCGTEFMSTYFEESKFLTRGISFNCSKKCKEINRGRRISDAKKELFEDEEYKEAVLSKTRATCLDKYGTENIFTSEMARAKSKATSLLRYGTEHPMQSEECLSRMRETCLARYGATSTLASKTLNPFPRGDSAESQNKIKRTCLDRYGSYPAALSDPVKKKIERTCLLRYGVSYPFKSEKILEKARNTQIKKYGELRGNRISGGENEVYLYLCDLLGSENVVRQVGGIVPRGRVDIVVPSKSMAIEFNGNYWHSEQVLMQKYGISRSDAIKHNLNRLNLCRSAGFENFLIVWSHDWGDGEKQVILKSMLSNLCGKTSIKINARDCVVRELSSAKEFLDANHLQGADASFLKLGLFSSDELVAVMTFRRSRDNKSIELSRYCNKVFTSVVGGFSKLLKHSKLTSLVSFSDNSYSNGNLYMNMGWTLDASLGPDYKILFGGKVYHKSSFRKSVLKKRFPEIYDPNKTEWEMENELGAVRLWDCGKKRWRFGISNSAIEGSLLS